MLLLDRIRKEIGDPAVCGVRYTPEQITAFAAAVDKAGKEVRKKAQSWEYIAVPMLGGPGDGLTEIEWWVMSPACKQYHDKRVPFHKFEGHLEDAAVNLAADLSTAAEIRSYRDEELAEDEPAEDEPEAAPDALVQLGGSPEEEPADDFILSPMPDDEND